MLRALLLATTALLCLSETSLDAAPPFREYGRRTTKKEVQDIRYILKTMSEVSIPALPLYHSKLEAAGARVEHVHPLRFMEVVFTHEDIKVYARNLRKRSFLWKRFYGGFSESLAGEGARGTLTQENIADFCQSVGVNCVQVTALLSAGRWHAFVDYLIKNVPRKGGPRKYDF